MSRDQMSQDRETPGRFEWPSPLRVAGERRDTGRIFRETVAEVTGGATVPPGSLMTVSAALPDAVRHDGEGGETVPGGRLFPADGWPADCLQLPRAGPGSHRRQ
jgi:hypothetical protein